jgi:hypothetical protein
LYDTAALLRSRHSLATRLKTTGNMGSVHFGAQNIGGVRWNDGARIRLIYLERVFNRANAPAGDRRMTAATTTSDTDVVFSPEVIEIMSAALEASIDSLPEPVSATQVHYLAESILNNAGRGERDAAVLKRLALVELRVLPRG